MRIRMLTTIVLGTAILAGSTATWAQRDTPERAGQSARERQMEQTQSRERVISPEQFEVRDRERAQKRDPASAAAQDRDRDQDRRQDQEREPDRDRRQDREHEPDQDRDRDRDRDRVHQDEIFGSQLMTEAERTQYREQMRTATDEQERAQIRARHREEMLQRAQERGVKLEEPTE